MPERHRLMNSEAQGLILFFLGLSIFASPIIGCYVVDAKNP
jgi:hypothetical protein